MSKVTIKTIVFENGLHLVHEGNNRTERRANIKWFVDMHGIYPDGELLVTDVCGYQKTADGWRRLENAETLEILKDGKKLLTLRAMGDGFVPPKEWLKR